MALKFRALRTDESATRGSTGSTSLKPQSVEGRQDPLSRLTPQERECLRLVAEQRSSKEIALALGIAKASVDTYCNRARAKLGVASRREAARMVANTDAVDVDGIVVEPAAQAALIDAPPPDHAPASRLATLGSVQRLGIIFMGASLFALAFGMLVNGLQSLNEVLGLPHALH